MNEIERTIRDLQLYVDVKWGGTNDMLNLALTALSEKAEREKGCEYCDDNFKFWQAQISGELPNVRFCPMCGKRLEVEHDG
jgi:hypothetical protein